MKGGRVNGAGTIQIMFIGTTKDNHIEMFQFLLSLPLNIFLSFFKLQSHQHNKFANQILILICMNTIYLENNSNTNVGNKKYDSKIITIKKFEYQR